MEFCLGHSKAYALILAYDLILLMTRADGIAMLPGWRASRGAQIENYVARHFPMMGISKAAAEEIERIKYPNFSTTIKNKQLWQEKTLNRK